MITGTYSDLNTRIANIMRGAEIPSGILWSIAYKIIEGAVRHARGPVGWDAADKAMRTTFVTAAAYEIVRDDIARVDYNRVASIDECVLWLVGAS